MAIRRDAPYIWTTWLPKLLVGRDSCLWSIWYKANYKDYVKVPNGFDTVNWNIKHTAALDKIEAEYKQKYTVVTRECQNAFQFKGRSGAVLAGKPDLIGMRGNEVRICDVKTGQQQDEHWAQMLLYMHFYPRCYPQIFGGKEITGEIIYNDNRQTVYADEFDEVFREQVIKMLQIVSSDTPPPKTPSSKDCGGCNIASEHCDVRVERQQESQQMVLGDF